MARKRTVVYPDWVEKHRAPGVEIRFRQGKYYTLYECGSKYSPEKKRTMKVTGKCQIQPTRRDKTWWSSALWHASSEKSSPQKFRNNHSPKGIWCVKIYHHRDGWHQPETGETLPRFPQRDNFHGTFAIVAPISAQKYGFSLWAEFFVGNVWKFSFGRQKSVGNIALFGWKS